MTSMMEAMLSMKRLIESNVAVAAASVTVHTKQTNPSRTCWVKEERCWTTPVVHMWGIIGMLTLMAYPPIIRHLPCTCPTRTLITPFPLPLRVSNPSL